MGDRLYERVELHATKVIVLSDRVASTWGAELRLKVSRTPARDAEETFTLLV